MTTQLTTTSLPTRDELLARAAERTEVEMTVTAADVRVGDRLPDGPWGNSGRPKVTERKTAKVNVTFTLDDSAHHYTLRLTETACILRPEATDDAKRAMSEAMVVRYADRADGILAQAKAALVEALAGDARYALSWRVDPLADAAEKAKWWGLVRVAAEHAGSWTEGVRAAYAELAGVILGQELPRTTSRVDIALAAIEHDARLRVRGDMRMAAAGLLDQD